SLVNENEVTQEAFLIHKERCDEPLSPIKSWNEARFPD
ncbi:unnamed protein product, partial [marine sediment metagenome]